MQYTITLRVDAKTVSFTESPDGKVHGTLDFILIVYDAKGRQVDSKLDRAVLALEPARYKNSHLMACAFASISFFPPKGTRYFALECMMR